MRLLAKQDYLQILDNEAQTVLQEISEARPMETTRMAAADIYVAGYIKGKRDNKMARSL